MLKWTIGLMIAASGFSVMFALPALADNGINEEILRCVSLDDAQERLACYDGLAGREMSTSDKSAAPAAAGVPAAASAPPPAVPPDDFGSESLGRKEDDGGEAPVAARVTRCVKDAGKDYNFYLDGGQVWKQISDRRLYYKDCNFNVTISRDFFGYRMQVEGERDRFRVRRVR